MDEEGSPMGPLLRAVNSVRFLPASAVWPHYIAMSFELVLMLTNRPN